MIIGGMAGWKKFEKMHSRLNTHKINVNTKKTGCIITGQCDKWKGPRLKKTINIFGNLGGRLIKKS